jgi:Restriction Enzyme Adenine Methylase Associated/Type I restriction enzyme R protein N terminus (HSDR_N)
MANPLPDKIAAQIAESLEHYRKPLRDARTRGASEGDTGLLVHGMLSDIFGYDKFLEITSEFKIKGQFADFAIKLDGKVLVIVEVKAISIKLNDQHIFQASSYAAQEGVEWVILSNASQWNLYRVEFTKPVNTTKVVTIEFIDGVPDQESLALFHRWGMQKGLPENFWSRMRALSAANLVRALLDDSILKALAAHIHRSSGLRIDTAELKERLIDDVLKDGLVGQVSLSDVGVYTPSASEPGRRVRLKALITGGYVQAGEELTADWNEQPLKATILANGKIDLDGAELSNLHEATQAATSGGSRAGWDFWKCSTGESMDSVRERFISATE